ncbi:S-adenosyl-L-methionine-dependent methyltransferase, partial [Podospora fimiseda]
PNTSAESARLKIQHELSLIDANGALHLAPLPDHLLHVADIGSGTGIWAKEFGSLHPQTQVLGIDLSFPPDFSSTAPSNAKFAVGNIQEPWPIPAGLKFDFIHGRQILINLPDPKAALRHVYNNLRPGGIVEFREWTRLGCQTTQGGRSTPPPLIIEWVQRVAGSARIINGCNLGFTGQMEQAIEEVGFLDIHVQNTEFPIGGWLMGEDEKDYERQKKLDKLARKMWQSGMPNMARSMFIKAFGWTEEEAVEFAERVMEDL